MKIMEKLQRLSKDPDSLDSEELKEMKRFISLSTVIFLITIIYLNNILNSMLFN